MSPHTPWVFITTTPSHTRPSRDQRQEINRRVMREIGEFRRKKTAKSSRFPVQDDCSSGDSSSDTQTSWLPTPTPPLLAPVAPLALDGDSRILFQHMFSDGSPSYFRIFRDRWYPVCLTHVGAFNQMLASYAMHLMLWRQTSVRAMRCLILTHHIKAITTVRDELPSASDSRAREGILLAITGLACHSHLEEDLPGWKQHIHAVSSFVRQPCFKWADVSPETRYLVEWVDSIGSYDLDIAPILEHKLIEGPSIPRDLPIISPVPISMQLEGLCPSISEAFSSLKSMNNQIERRYSEEGEQLWQRPAEVDALVDPVTRKFLSLPRDLGGSSAWTCLRSGALLYLAEFRRRSGIRPVLFGLHLRQLGLGLRNCAGGLDPRVRLWLLTVGMIEQSGSVEADVWDRVLEETLIRMKIGSMSEWQDSLREIVWLDVLFNGKLDSMSGIIPSLSQ